MSITPLDCFGSPPPTLPPSIPVRRWDEAILMGSFALLAAFALTAFLVWRDLPFVGAKPSGTFLMFVAIVLSPRHWASMDWATLARLLSVVVPSFLVACWAFRFALRPQVRLRHLSGPRLLRGRDAEKAARREVVHDCGKAPGFLSLHPSLMLAKSRWTRHVLVVGSVGSGKTQIIAPIVQRAFDANHKMFCYDVKGDFTSKFPDAALLSPWDKRSRIWDVGADVRTVSDATAFAASFIPTDGDGSNRYFSIAAQEILIGTLRGLQAEMGKRWGWSELADRLRSDQAAFVAMMTKHHPKALPIVSDASSTATSGVLASLAAYTRTIDDLAAAWGNTENKKRVSLRRWLRDDYTGRRQLIVQGGPDAGLTRVYIGAMVRVLEGIIVSSRLPDDEQGRTLLFVLDELPSLHVDISALIDKGRSKGVCVVAGLQDLAQLRASLGPDKAQALVSMVGTHIICRIQLGESREQIAGLLGRERVSFATSSSSSGTGGNSSNLGVHEETRAVVDPSMLSTELGIQRSKRRDWPHGFAVRALVSLGGDVLMLDFPGLVLPDRQRGHVPAKWTEPTTTPMAAAITEKPTAQAPSMAPDALAALAARFARPAQQNL